jgi:aspartate aminotransferase
VVYDGASHRGIAALPGMYERTIPIYTFSKTYAVTGLRLGYLAVENPALREHILKLLFLTTSNVSSVVQHGGIATLEGPQDMVEEFRTELRARRDLFYTGIADVAAGVFIGTPPQGAFYAFLRINPAWTPPPGSRTDSRSWAMVEHLIARGRVGCVPGVDFGAAGEDYVRFCFARERSELEGALAAIRDVFGAR